MDEIYENNTISKQAAFVISNQGETSFTEIVNDVESISTDKIGTGTYKLIESIVENKDKYSWVQLSCFYRPLAIMYDLFMPGCFDMFLFMVSYYNTHMVDDWFKNANERTVNSEFFKFHESVMKPKTGLSFKRITYKDKSEMCERIINLLKENYPVLIPVDIYSLYYTLRYKRYHHRHYMIIKGYDEERKIFQVLDKYAH